VNRRFSEWHGVRSEEAIGKTTADLFPGRSAAAMLAQERELIATGRSSRREETVAFRDGTLHRLEIVKFLVPGPTLAIGSLASDVTEQRQIEERLRHGQKLEAVGQLACGVAHDFNNLLSVILGNFEILGDLTKGDRDAAQAVQRGISATRRGADLTRRLLAFSRRQTLNPRAVDINALIGEATQLLARTLGGSIAVRTRLGHGVRAVFVDPGQLEDALLNLALNARDAMPDGGTLTVETANVSSAADARAHEPEHAAGDYVLVTVRDTGTGMPPEIVARAFEPFFTTKEVGKGSGLGLSMVHGFVTQSGGQVVIESAVGQGTAVKLYLPVAASAASQSSAPEEKAKKGSGQRILLLEDDPFVRETVTGQLESLDYQVTAVASGAEALAQLRGGAGFDLLLADIVLPGGTSGIDIAELASSARPATRVLLMSGYANAPAAAERIAALGASLLVKPFAVSDLSRAIKRALRRDAAAEHGAEDRGDEWRGS
jgi:two-component system CheB/CheR fusion protein